jgi:DNA/RNA endonuclease YhcR with UshA esterase domain
MRIVASLIVGLATLLASVGALSHHSFSAEFDVGRPVTLEGTVKEMEWTNPHAWIHLVVQDEQGNAQEWSVELLGVNSLIRSGMSPKTVVPGDRLTISGFGARNGTNTANASTVTRTGSAESLWTSVRE